MLTSLKVYKITELLSWCNHSIYIHPSDSLCTRWPRAASLVVDGWKSVIFCKTTMHISLCNVYCLLKWCTFKAISVQFKISLWSYVTYWKSPHIYHCNMKVCHVFGFSSNYKIGNFDKLWHSIRCDCHREEVPSDYIVVRHIDQNSDHVTFRFCM